MKYFLKKYQEIFLIVLTVLFLIILTLLYFFVISKVSGEFRRVLDYKGNPQAKIRFNLEDAKKLNTPPVY
jgi:uncharacterized protein YqhQ